jgi:hypothetical protein
MKKYMINKYGDMMFADDEIQESILLPKNNQNIEVEHTDKTDPDEDVNIEPVTFHRELIHRLSIIQKLAYNV